jgi:UDP-N-acetylglucosamine--N-acetylmuramyl-(pentapeptide) pyrophosphoryl-undecaprenol N-acetylglucosamine transferase
LPSILIPYPFAADDHQTRNAEIFSVPSAAVLWKQEELHEGNFSRRIVELLSDDDRIASMKGAMEKLAIEDASAQVCEVIVNQIREGN